jgi:TM2 domain-containing membrane protein YozV
MMSEEVSVALDQSAGIAQGKFCASCGSQINEKAVICPKCGVAVKSIGTGEKNPGIAAVLSFFFTGLGQIYNGEIGKGLLMMIVQMLNVALMFVVIGFITFPILWGYGIWDANKRAKEINAQ